MGFGVRRPRIPSESNAPRGGAVRAVGLDVSSRTGDPRSRGSRYGRQAFPDWLMGGAATLRVGWPHLGWPLRSSI